MESTVANGGSSLKQEFQEKGNQAFEEESFASAAIEYTKALDIDPKDTSILTSRIISYINIGCYTLALKDSETILSINPNCESSIIHKVKSLWGLRRYKDALNFLETEVTPESLKNPNLSSLKSHAFKMIEQSEGKYNILEIFNLPPRKRHDIAEYKGPIEIAIVPGKGRGLLATRDIKPGELLICAKAFAIIYGDSDEWFLKKGNANYRTIQLMITIFQKMVMDASVREEFCGLSAGEDSKFDRNWLLNQFNLNSKDSIKSNDDKEKYRKEIEDEISNRVATNFFSGKYNQSIGIWILPAYLNCKCLDSNAFWINCSDIMLIRAVSFIKKGEEITITYTTLDESRFQKIKQHKFICDCRLCKMEREESSETLEEIHKTLESIQTNLIHTDKENLNGQINRVRKLISLRGNNANCNISLVEDCVSELVTQLMNEKQWKVAIGIYKKARSVYVNSAFIEGLIGIDWRILICYTQMGDKEQIAKWKKQLDLDLISAHGIEVMDWEVEKRFRLLEKIADFQEYYN